MYQNLRKFIQSEKNKNLMYRNIKNMDDSELQELIFFLNKILNKKEEIKENPKKIEKKDNIIRNKRGHGVLVENHGVRLDNKKQCFTRVNF